MGIIRQFLIRTQLRMRPEKSNRVIYKGFLFKGTAIDIRENMCVITPDGIGEIKTVITDWSIKKNVPESIDVYLYSGFIKRYQVLTVSQLIVRHGDKFIKLSPSCYRYFYTNGQPIEYRVTKRNYVMLTDDSKRKYSHIKTISKSKGGNKLLKLVQDNNLEILKK